MKQFLLLFFVSLGLSVSAQLNLNISPAPISVEDSPNAPDIKVDFTVSNMDVNNEASFLWRIANADDIPEGWYVYICDINLCYFHTVHTCPESNPNLLGAGASHEFQYHVTPHGFENEFTGMFELFTADQPDVVLSSVEITVSTLTSSTDEIEDLENFAIYPNPTAQSFQIKNDKNVGSIAIYNIIGKQIENHIHTPGNLYDVSHFRKGMYFVRLFDVDGQTIKSIRLNKE